MCECLCVQDEGGAGDAESHQAFLGSSLMGGSDRSSLQAKRERVDRLVPGVTVGRRGSVQSSSPSLMWTPRGQAHSAQSNRLPASPRHTGGGARSLRVAAAAETAPDHNFGGTSSARGSDTSDLFDLNKPLVPASIPEHLQPPEELAVDLQDQEELAAFFSRRWTSPANHLFSDLSSDLFVQLLLVISNLNRRHFAFQQNFFTLMDEFFLDEGRINLTDEDLEAALDMSRIHENMERQQRARSQAPKNAKNSSFGGSVSDFKRGAGGSSGNNSRRRTVDKMPTVAGLSYIFALKKQIAGLKRDVAQEKERNKVLQADVETLAQRLKRTMTNTKSIIIEKAQNDSLMVNMQRKFAEAADQLADAVDSTMDQSMALNARKLLEMEQGQFQKNLRGTESLLQNRLRLLGNVIQELQDTFDRHQSGESLALEIRNQIAALEVHRQNLNERFFDMRESISETRQQLFHALKDVDTAKKEAASEAKVSRHNKITLKEYRAVFENFRQIVEAYEEHLQTFLTMRESSVQPFSPDKHEESRVTARRSAMRKGNAGVRSVNLSGLLSSEVKEVAADGSLSAGRSPRMTRLSSKSTNTSLQPSNQHQGGQHRRNLSDIPDMHLLEQSWDPPRNATTPVQEADASSSSSTYPNRNPFSRFLDTLQNPWFLTLENLLEDMKQILKEITSITYSREEADILRQEIELIMESRKQSAINKQLLSMSEAKYGVFDPLEAQRAKSPGGESSARGASPPTRQPSRPQIRITRDSSIAEVGDFLRQREDSGNKDESQSKKLAILQDAIQRSRQLDTKPGSSSSPSRPRLPGTSSASSTTPGSASRDVRVSFSSSPSKK